VGEVLAVSLATVSAGVAPVVVHVGSACILMFAARIEKDGFACLFRKELTLLPF